MTLRLCQRHLKLGDLDDCLTFGVRGRLIPRLVLGRYRAMVRGTLEAANEDAVWRKAQDEDLPHLGVKYSRITPVDGIEYEAIIAQGGWDRGRAQAWQAFHHLRLVGLGGVWAPPVGSGFLHGMCPHCGLPDSVVHVLSKCMKQQECPGASQFCVRLLRSGGDPRVVSTRVLYVGRLWSRRCRRFAAP